MCIKKQFLVFFICLVSIVIGLLSCRTETIVDARQLIAKIDNLEFAYTGTTGGYNFPVSDDIAIWGTVEIASDELTAPEECLSNEFCSDSIFFKNSYEHPGIQISGPQPGCQDGVSNLSLTNVVVRLRKQIVFMAGTPPGPAEFPYTLYTRIEILPPADARCDEGQMKCDVDKVCYDRYQNYCLFCLALTQKECACRDESGLLDNGTTCNQFTRPDAIETGKCFRGKCYLSEERKNESNLN